jgi:hypothetical protein
MQVRMSHTDGNFLHLIKSRKGGVGMRGSPTMNGRALPPSSDDNSVPPFNQPKKTRLIGHKFRKSLKEFSKFFENAYSATGPTSNLKRSGRKPVLDP